MKFSDTDFLRALPGFVKMEGTANDYVFFDALDFPADAVPVPNTETIRRISDRRTGVGGDGVVLIAPPQSPEARARMLMWNADGSSSAMCGNALRCIALHVHRRSGETEFVLESGAGSHRARVLEFDESSRSGVFEIDVGPPIFAAERIPFKGNGHSADGPLIDVPLQLEVPTALRDHGSNDLEVRGVVVSMGNPHLVLFVDDADREPVELLGPLLEHHPAFPERTNVEFVSPDPELPGLYQRTFERGSGETLSCGSGACAVHVAAVLTGRAERRGKIRVRGGVLELEWNGDVANPGGVKMRGPARVAFTGTL